MALALVLALPGCKPDLQLAATNLQVTPDPAQPGQAVTFTFHLTILPAQGYTVIAFIDEVEHTRVTGFSAHDGLFPVEVGAATDLIAQYGLGTHEGAVEVRLDDRNRSATAARTFTLEESPPPPPPAPQR